MSTYVIFGAAGDIGLSYILHLIETQPGTRVLAFCNRSYERIEALASPDVIPVRCDLTDISLTERILSETAERYPDISHFISFAYGRLRYDRVTAFSAEETERNFRIQVTACGIALSKLIPVMKKNRSGRIIIMTSSAAAGMPPAFMSEYVIVKYAAIGMIRSYAGECSKYGITVNGIAPSMVDTRLWDGLSPLLREMNVKNHPQKRSVTFEEINACIDYIASPASGFLTGENIVLSGGESF